jgi:hypothetical protein
MSAVLLGGEGDVYALSRSRSFHEWPDCVSMLAGQIVHMCRCGDVYCGCAGEVPAKPNAMSLGDAAMEGLKPCGTCYPGFGELDVQLPADEPFDHVRVFIDGDWFCKKCRTVHEDEYGDRSKYPTLWPCVSAVVLKLAAPVEDIP